MSAAQITKGAVFEEMVVLSAFLALAYLGAGTA
jgi:hypothetical protein